MRQGTQLTNAVKLAAHVVATWPIVTVRATEPVAVQVKVVTAVVGSAKVPAPVVTGVDAHWNVAGRPKVKPIVGENARTPTGRGLPS